MYWTLELALRLQEMAVLHLHTVTPLTLQALLLMPRLQTRPAFSLH